VQVAEELEVWAETDEKRTSVASKRVCGKREFVMGRVQKNLPQGLNRLRKNPERMEKIPKRVPQGLKPVLCFVAFAARLKPCPCYKTRHE
jgi:hypothetical protein